LLGCETDYVYLLSIFRNRHTPSFTLGELSRLRQTCHFLIPLLAACPAEHALHHTIARHAVAVF
jgi:hypothetical protein